ncbi:OmcA/MtrC family decaheme c-type cytochrome [Ferrimonas marina]|nr:OmcA/MtrC family decaheme c-type cytochrome [Ferrimonas marina]
MKTTRNHWRLLASVSLVSLALTGCSDGDDGQDGEDGQPGPVGIHIDEASSVGLSIQTATVEGGELNLTFSAEDARGVAVYGLSKDHDLRFGVAQLAPVVITEGEGENAVEIDYGLQWVAYLNADVAQNPDWVPADDPDLAPVESFLQAQVEAAANCEDCLTDNGDGTYAYRYQVNLDNVTEPVAVSYDGDLTHRVTIELQQGSYAANAHYDWQPSSGAIDGIASRDVVRIEACYACHQPDSLALHGGRRLDLENCASCHTQTSGDPESGNLVDWTYMVHAIHKGQDRHSTSADSETGVMSAPYKVIGYGGGVHDYGQVMYPQKPMADCSACHVTGEGAPADADLWQADQNPLACVGCHTDVPHGSKPGQVYDNCTSCHNVEGYARGAIEAHGDATAPYRMAEQYSTQFSNIAITDGVLSFDLKVLDEAGNPVEKDRIYKEGYSKPYVVVSWDIEQDYPAYQEGIKYSDRRQDIMVHDYDEASHTFSVNASSIVLPDLNGKTVELLPVIKTCFSQGGYGRPEIVPMSCYDAESGNDPAAYPAYIQDEPLRFVWSDGVDAETEVAERRPILDTQTCHDCHGAEFYHDSNGVNCQSCHTSDKSVKNYGSAEAPNFGATSFAWKGHKATGHYLKYGGVQSGTVMKTDCLTCHTAEGFELGRAPDRVWQYPTSKSDGTPVFVSSDAGACLSCHFGHLDETAVNHMQGYGAVLDGSDQLDVQTRSAESCATCHKPEQILEIHGN